MLAATCLPLACCGCSYAPDMGNNGYQPCERGNTCPGGFDCLEGVCVPDCEALEKLAYIEPSDADDGMWSCSPGAECEVGGLVDDGPSSLRVVLPGGDYLELGPGHLASYPEGCRRLVIQAALLADEKNDGRELSVLLVGNKDWQPVWGVARSLALEGLSADESGGNVEAAFRQNTIFLIVSTETFGWPIRVRLLPREDEELMSRLTFAVRDFRMYCCVGQ